MFEINKYLIGKMGWTTYSMSRGVRVNISGNLPFADDPLVRFFIDIKDHYICYLIKEFSDKEKQKTNKQYKFIRMDYNPSIIDKDGIPNFTITGIGSNKELFEMIIKHRACNSEYKRHFTINKIFK